MKRTRPFLSHAVISLALILLPLSGGAVSPQGMHQDPNRPGVYWYTNSNDTWLSTQQAVQQVSGEPQPDPVEVEERVQDTETAEPQEVEVTVSAGELAGQATALLQEYEQKAAELAAKIRQENFMSPGVDSLIRIELSDLFHDYKKQLIQILQKAGGAQMGPADFERVFSSVIAATGGLVDAYSRMTGLWATSPIGNDTMKDLALWDALYAGASVLNLMYHGAEVTSGEVGLGAYSWQVNGTPVSAEESDAWLAAAEAMMGRIAGEVERVTGAMDDSLRDKYMDRVSDIPDSFYAFSDGVIPPPAISPYGGYNPYNGSFGQETYYDKDGNPIPAPNQGTAGQAGGGAPAPIVPTPIQPPAPIVPIQPPVIQPPFVQPPVSGPLFDSDDLLDM